MNFFTFGKTHVPATLTRERAAITLRSQHDSNQTTVEALAVPEISAVTSPPGDGAIIDIMRSRGMLPADACPGVTTFQEDEVSVLIGSDIHCDVATGEITRVSPRVTAAETLFRWTIRGTLHPLSQGCDARTPSSFTAVEAATANDADLDMGISNLWRIDALGLQDTPEGSQDDILSYELFEQHHVSKKGQRYQVPILSSGPRSGRQPEQLRPCQTAAPHAAATLPRMTRSCSL
ncbi:hypothetical protein HPB50_008787 [Hyalomma asiaticum]|uniref:Uncharacterized protein n=1 Tax=Hyalomma asiaticum TaxID=266040 RepID=A0ACB7TD87_HYAAI|nr:hypothetical protein HPB50_008787 [Hyalomma asiaticum]